MRSLHEGLDDPVIYHVLLPIEDAAARIEASMGSLAAGEVMASPAWRCARSTSRRSARTAATAPTATSPPPWPPSRRPARPARRARWSPSRRSTPSPTRSPAVDGREAIILTRPHVVAEFFHVDWTSRARRKLGVPVLHLLEHENFDEQAGGGEGVTGL